MERIFSGLPIPGKFGRDVSWNYISLAVFGVSGILLNAGIARYPVGEATFEVSISVHRDRDDPALARFRIDVVTAFDALKVPAVRLQ